MKNAFDCIKYYGSKLFIKNLMAKSAIFENA